MTRFVYEGDHVAVEYDGAGAVRRRYAWAPGADRPILQAEGATLDCATARFLHADHQGSIVATAHCAGQRLNVNSYDEYGVPAAGNWGRFQYTGQAWLPDLGMYHYKARIYAPQIGRFLQTDPIGYEDQINLYAYVGNDPVNSNDPLGMARVCTQVTGSAIPACVGVDGNGDGNWKDNDLTANQKADLSSQFHDAIVDNRGKDLSTNGKPVIGSGTAAEKSMTRAVSQFVGTSLGDQIGWANISYIRADRDKGMFGYVTGACGGNAAPACVNGREGFIWITGQRASLFSGTPYTPSQLARYLIHESLHTIRGLNLEVWPHIRMDQEAKRLLRAGGLAGGGCPGGSGFYSCRF